MSRSRRQLPKVEVKVEKEEPLLDENSAAKYERFPDLLPKPPKMRVQRFINDSIDLKIHFAGYLKYQKQPPNHESIMGYLPMKILNVKKSPNLPGSYIITTDVAEFTWRTNQSKIDLVSPNGYFHHGLSDPNVNVRQIVKFPLKIMYYVYSRGRIPLVSLTIGIIRIFSTFAPGEKKLKLFSLNRMDQHQVQTKLLKTAYIRDNPDELCLEMGNLKFTYDNRSISVQVSILSVARAAVYLIATKLAPFRIEDNLRRVDLEFNSGGRRHRVREVRYYSYCESDDLPEDVHKFAKAQLNTVNASLQICYIDLTNTPKNYQVEFEQEPEIVDL